MMDRPSSQLENLRPSGLKPPSKLPAMSANVGRTLVETSQSDLNARVGGAGSVMPPPTTGPVKHKINGLPESAPKRKTLAERAGEPINPIRSHFTASSKPSRKESSSASLHGRTPSSSTNSQRNGSNISTVANTGAGRPPSRQNLPRQVGLPRPPSVTDSRLSSVEDETDSGLGSKRKGTPLPSFNSFNGISFRKTRKQADRGNDSSTSPSTSTSTRSQHSGSRVRVSSSSTQRAVSAVQFYDEHSSQRKSSTPSEVESFGAASRKDAQNIPPIRTSSLVTALEELSLRPTHESHRTLSGHRATPQHLPSLERIKEELSPSKIPKYSCTPSLRHAPSLQPLTTPSPLKDQSCMIGLRTPVTGARRCHREQTPVFLTKEKLTPTTAWDTKGRLEDMETLYAQLRSQFASAHDSKSALEESLGLYKSRVQELNQLNKEISSTNRDLSTDLERARNDLHTTTTDFKQAKRDHERDMQDAERSHDRALNDLYDKQEREARLLERELEKISENGEKQMQEAKRAWEKQKDGELAEMTTQHWDEIEEVKASHQGEIARLQTQLDELQRSGENRATESAVEVQKLRDSVKSLEDQLDAAKTNMTTLRSQIAAAETRTNAIEQERSALISKAHFLEGNQEAQSLEFTSMSEKLQDAINSRNATVETLRKEEILRRKLNATILELKGNIRVFVRTRPLLSGEEDPAKIEFPDRDSLDGGKEMVVQGPTTLSATGKERAEKHSYAFDRVFDAGAANSQVFDDCRDLIQSVVDGYNVSILSYGQTGSGKTYGMSGPDGIIPSSIGLLLAEMNRLKEKGWEYIVEASFVEVYNETLNDLLGDAKSWDDADDLSASVRGKKKEKHEVHHDSTTGKTHVTNLSAVTLWPPPQDDGQWPPSAMAFDGEDPAVYTEQAVNKLLDTATKNRRVAATKANERSSRSHSVFILTLKGSCATSGQSSEGILNLVDLAGSERLKQSGAEGNRMKETQAINKSLSALGDVIGALGAKKGDDSHIPYRNSKLTYLLQSSLGGTTAGKSSRTLMLLHLSPLQAHWQESRSSLLFGSKASASHIGAAKKR